MYVLFNIIEVSDNEYYNTSVALDPQGNVTPYRKRILFETEYPYASPGDNPVLLETPFGKFGLMICIDGFETNAQDSLDRGFYNGYKAAGANAILIPMNWDIYDSDNEFAAQLCLPIAPNDSRSIFLQAMPMTAPRAIGRAAARATAADCRPP